MARASILYLAAAAPTLAFDGETMLDPQHYICGTLADGSVVLHAQPGVDAIAPITVYRDGSAAWTWNDVAAELGADWCAHVAPHEWAGEPTAADLDVTAFPLLTPPASDEEII